MDGTDGEFKRPPTGVIPETVWKDIRMCELSRALHDYIKAKNFRDSLHEWADELYNLLLDKRNSHRD